MNRATLLFGMLAFIGNAHSQITTIGDWSIGRTAGEAGYFAASMNDSGAVFGKYCFAESASCFWVFNNKNTTCNDGLTYPVMVNAANGAFATSLYCKPLDGKARLVFEDFEILERGIKGADQIGFAFPMQNGQFAVSRFNTARFESAASALARLSATLTSPSPGTRNTRDQRL